MKKLILMAAAALLLMTQCRKNADTLVTPDTVKMTVTVNQGRVNVDEQGAITWEPEDLLFISKLDEENNVWKWFGLLHCTDATSGTFEGNVTGYADGKYKFFYFGNNFYSDDNFYSEVNNNNTKGVFVRLTDQTGKLEDVGKYQVGWSDVIEVTNHDVKNVKLNSAVALARFDFGNYKDIIMIGKVNNMMEVTPDGEFTGSGKGISIFKGNSGVKYVILVPTANTEAVELNFNYAETGGIMFHTGIEAGKYYGKYEPFVVSGLTAPNLAVDLGFESGTKWASCNVGAYSAEDFGNYYAWGETVTKSRYDWTTYFDGKNPFSKYNSKGGLTTLESIDDAAAVNWGGNWRIPSKEDWEELMGNTEVVPVQRDGVKGLQFTSTKNGNSIFIPKSGFMQIGNLVVAVNNYVLHQHLPVMSIDGFDDRYVKSIIVGDGSGNVSFHNDMRSNGFPIRPVCK